MKFFLASLACFTLLAQAGSRLATGPEVDAALHRISADSLRGHLSFIASDALEGRDTPSRGLDIAAEYIAAQFRRAALEAPVDGGYFETADFVWVTRVTEGFSLVLDRAGAESIHLGTPDADVVYGNSAIDCEHVHLFKLADGDAVPKDVEGKAVLAPAPLGSALMDSLREKKAALILTSGRRGESPPGRELVAADQLESPSLPVIAVRDDAVNELFKSLPVGRTSISVSLHAPPSLREPVKLRNVIGLVRGSDPELKNTYVLVTAHYDHLGMKASGGGDRIFNGANDDGSGTVSVIEMASAIAAMQPHPRRSIVFMTVFGEEEGLLGSQYYARHPVFPLKQTVADINLEQIGRTDDSDGPQVKSATFTGFTYSDLPALFVEAGKAVGVKVYDRNTGNDPFFARSDNQALADAGIPSHTVAVGLEFPDYHQVGDEWNKIDYTNMATVDRMLALGIISLANHSEAPRWNEANPNATRYVNAWKTLQSAPAH